MSSALSTATLNPKLLSRNDVHLLSIPYNATGARKGKMIRLLSVILFWAAVPSSSLSAIEDEGRQLEGDFDWGIVPTTGYPSIAFEDSSTTKEVIFKYTISGTPGPYKNPTFLLLDKNCNASADHSSLAAVKDVTGNELQVDVDIIEERIVESMHYHENEQGTSATIDFCLRIDYNYKDSATNAVTSVNFHETTVTITVDLTANFTLTGITTSTASPTEDLATSSLVYPVEAYYCSSNNGKVPSFVMTPGKELQFCVTIRNNVTADVMVDDIMEFTISQPLSYPLTEPLSPIVKKKPDRMTSKTCTAGKGVCNVKHQLSSKWFQASKGNNVGNGNGNGNGNVGANGNGNGNSNVGANGNGNSRLLADAWTWVVGTNESPFVESGVRRLGKPVPPPPLQVDGVAVIGFGVVSGTLTGGRRQLKVPFRGILKSGVSGRHLQESESSFGLEVELGFPDETTTPETSRNMRPLRFLALVVIVFLLGSCLLSFAYSRQKENEDFDKEKAVATSSATIVTSNDDESLLTGRPNLSLRPIREIEEETLDDEVVVTASDDDFDPQSDHKEIPTIRID